LILPAWENFGAIVCNILTERSVRFTCSQITNCSLNCIYICILYNCIYIICICRNNCNLILCRMYKYGNERMEWIFIFYNYAMSLLCSCLNILSWRRRDQQKMACWAREWQRKLRFQLRNIIYANKDINRIENDNYLLTRFIAAKLFLVSIKFFRKLIGP